MKASDRKAARMARQHRHDAEPLSLRTESFGALEYKTLEKGVVRFTESSAVGDVPPPNPLMRPRRARFELSYEGMQELVADHGDSVVSGVLIDADLWMLSEPQRKAMISEIKASVSEALWPMVAERMLLHDDGDPHAKDPFVIGTWAEIFLKPLSDVWLAAMANHAYADRNYFAYGYLVAQLDHRNETEPHFLRGRKSVESGRAGAEALAKQSSPRTKAVLHEMRRLIDGNHSISRAAEIAADHGVGTSAGANEKLWHRHTKSP